MFLRVVKGSGHFLPLPLPLHCTAAATALPLPLPLQPNLPVALPLPLPLHCTATATACHCRNGSDQILCKIDSKNPKFEEGENMGILSTFHPEPVSNLGPKIARINMIGASGGSETTAQPPQGYSPASERVPIEQQHWRCEICKGNWYETNEFGADWMVNKVQILMRKTGALSHECDACTGVTWDGGHEKRGTETGLYWAGNTP
jgi:hypothetical protein